MTLCGQGGAGANICLRSSAGRIDHVQGSHLHRSCRSCDEHRLVEHRECNLYHQGLEPCHERLEHVESPPPRPHFLSISFQVCPFPPMFFHSDLAKHMQRSLKSQSGIGLTEVTGRLHWLKDLNIYSNPWKHFGNVFEPC